MCKRIHNTVKKGPTNLLQIRGRDVINLHKIVDVYKKVPAT